MPIFPRHTLKKTMKLNPNFKNMTESYLFVEIAKRVAEYKEQNPKADIIRLGIGDVTRPIARPVVQAMEAAAREQGEKETFHGYAPEQGYDFLRSAVSEHYAKRGVKLELGEIFISDGAKSDLGNISELFTQDNTVLIPDPVYPAYVDTNVLAGREIIYANATKENNFLPMPDPKVKADIIYMCSPNNPTGAVYSAQQLEEWVIYANSMGAVIIFDSAYESFITQDNVPRSIFEVKGAEKCAIEICSLSKTAGFTGTRCGYTIIPHALESGGQSLNKLWARRQATKFNEVSYIVQRGAAAVFSPEGMAASLENVNYYLNNAKVIAAALDKLGVWYCGGVHSPYIWLETPNSLSSWEFFDLLLNKAALVGTPGAGFGKMGEGYFRLTGFGDAQKTAEAAQRLTDILK